MNSANMGTEASAAGATSANQNGLWVLLKVENQSYGLPAAVVQEMVRLPEVVSLPGAVDYVRGMITFRGRALPLVDLRTRLGRPTLEEEQRHLTQMFQQRDEDHRHWLAELEISVREQKPFGLALDPHECGFGRWYDGYRTDDLMLAALLRKFDEPHRRIHGIAREVMALADRGQHEEALAIIQRTHDIELAEMIRLFAQARSLLENSRREIALVLAAGQREVAVAVDGVEAVEPLIHPDGTDVNDLLARVSASLALSVGQRPRTKGLVILLEAHQLVADERLAGQSRPARAGS